MREPVDGFARLLTEKQVNKLSNPLTRNHCDTSHEVVAITKPVLAF